MSTLPPVRSVAVFTRGVRRIPHLAELCGAGELLYRPSNADARNVGAVLAWGRKPSARPAEAYARRHHLPLWRAEDGFLRSVGLGVAGEPPLSIVVDDIGIYYDARAESRLERLIAGGDALADPALLERARRAMARMREARLSKYNNAPPGPVDLGPAGRRRVLVVDQTAGDLSVPCSLATPRSFEQMLEAALDENPDAEVVVKTHPDVLAGKKRGYLQHATGGRIKVFARACPPLALCSAMDRVYVVCSQLGFEALIAGCKVTCFGAPWYAGWGATDDRLTIPRRGRTHGVEALFAAAYLLYARYLDPDTRRAGEIEHVIEHLAIQRSVFEENRGKLFCFGFRFWKRGYMRAYLKSPGNAVLFPPDVRAAERRGIDGLSRILVWGQRESEEVRALADRNGIPIWRVEDGFLRSVGLGSDLAMPASLVVDRAGIYYDPNRPSDLELLLESATFTAPELARAAALREKIVGAGLSKYNLGADLQLAVPAGRRVVLVPGQVEDDASVRLGCRSIRTNLALLESARTANPGAFIIYKPHPDVLSGNRNGRVDPTAARALSDHVETVASLARCLEASHEVHTMTSLVGFEALLRGKRVVVYGQPFYAGWGLTEDRDAVARRTRRLTLDELVAGALLRYPRYLDAESGRFTTPEATIARLLVERDAGSTERKVEMPWLRRQLRKIVYAYRGLVHAP